MAGRGAGAWEVERLKHVASLKRRSMAKGSRSDEYTRRRLMSSHSRALATNDDIDSAYVQHVSP